MSETKLPLVEFIKRIHPQLNLDQITNVVVFFKEVQIPKGEIVIEEGKISHLYYYLEKGCVRSYTKNFDGEEVTTGIYLSGHVVCDLMPFFKRIPAMENYQTESDCKMFSVSFDEIQKAFHSLPEFREFGRAMLVSEYGALKMRSLSTLHQTAEDRYASLLKSSPDIFQHIALKNIASYLGITDSSLSRIRKELAKK